MTDRNQDELIDQICDRFEQSWRAGERPNVASQLRDAPQPPPIRLLKELVALDIKYRCKAGEQAQVEDYSAEFPQLKQDVVVLRELIEVEQQIREKHAADLEPPCPTQQHDGIHTRCPHCHNPIELVENNSLKDIPCPSCGSSFNLLGEETTITNRGKTRSIAHFELLEQIGVGAFGAVWKAFDTKLDRFVAIKIPREDQVGPQEAEQFFREARAAAQLTHPHIVRVYEVGRDEDNIFIASDFIKGANLNEWLRGQRLTLREAAALSVKLAEALHHAHEAGVIHRDLKPSNVMLDLEGEPHVMDFGLAKREAGEITMTMDGQILGTPAYMSPEQAKGKGHEADRRSDVYSLGVMLFELITGELPFRGETRMLIVQILKDAPPAPRTLDNRISRDMETICLKCIEKEPEKRYQTAQELADDLQCYMKHEPIQARPVSRSEKLRRWCKRKPALAALWVTASVLSLTFGIGGPWMALQQANYAKQQELFAKEESFLRGMAEAAQKLTDEKRVEAEYEKEKTRQNLIVAEKNAYNSDMLLVQREWNEGNYERVKELLDRYQNRGELKGFEWSYWKRENLLLLTLKGHKGPVDSASFSPDGTQIVSASDDTTLKLWDAETGQEILTLKGHENSVHSVAYSPDGKRIVSGSSDKTAKVWDVETGQELLTFRGHARTVRSVSFSPDGKRIVSASDDTTLKLWDAETGQEILTLKGHENTVHSVAYSPDGKRIVSGSSDKTAKVWNVQSGEEVLTLRGHARTVRSVLFSPDSKRIISASDDTTLKLWDAKSGLEMLTLKGGHPGSGNPGWVHGVDFSPDGKRIVSGSGNTNNPGEIKVWDVGTGQVMLSLKGHSIRNATVSFSPDGSRIVSSSYDHTLRVWDVETSHQESLAFERHRKRVPSVAFSPDGKRIVSGSFDTTVKLWDVETGRETLTLKGHNNIVNSVGFSPDGKQIVSGSSDKTAKLWNAETGQETLTFKGHTDVVFGVAFSPDGKQIVSGSRDTSVKVWGATTGQETLTLIGHDNSVYNVSFSPNNKWIISCGRDMTVKLWDASTGQEQLTLVGHTGPVIKAKFSPNNKRIVSCSRDNTARVWDTATGQELFKLEGHLGNVIDVDFSPDGKRIVSCSFDKTLKVWDAATGRETLTLKGHNEKVLSVAFSPDGKRIVSGCQDSTVNVWDARPWSTDQRVARQARFEPGDLIAGLKPLHVNEFIQEPQIFGSGGKSPLREYRDGQLYMTHNQGGIWAWTMTSVDDGIIDITARVEKGDQAGWVVVLHQDKIGHGISISVFEDRLNISRSIFDPSSQSGPQKQSIPLSYQDSIGQSHRLQLVIKSQSSTITPYLDGRRISDPIKLDDDITPAKLLLGIVNTASEGHVASVSFERYAFYPVRQSH